MRAMLRMAGCAAAMLASAIGPAAYAQQASAPPQSITLPRMSLKSTAFEDGGIIPPKFTQSVATPISPELVWSDVPADVMTFALIVTDLDTAPQKSSTGVLHWLVFNIPGSARTLPEAVPPVQVLPDGTVQGRNVRKFVGYRGPGAPDYVPYHHYSFELYALDTLLDLGPEASRADVLEAMNGHVIAKAATVGRYHK